MTRIRESTQAQYLRRREQKRLQNPNQKQRHSLSKIDAEKMIATCSVCGRTDIRKKGAFYICAKKKRAYAREYRLLHYVPQPRKPRQSGHSLSEIDDESKTAVCLQCGRVRIYVSHVQGKTLRRCSKAHCKYVIQARQNNKQFLVGYKVQRGCQRCGHNTNPVALELHRGNLTEKDVQPSKLIMFGRERLLQELEKSDVLCTTCHRLVHRESILPT